MKIRFPRLTSPDSRNRGSSRRRRPLFAEYLEDRQLLTVNSAELFDFGFYGPVAPNATAINLNQYDATKGYGWTAFIGAASETGGPDPLLSGYNYGTNNSFRVDLPNGTYTVKATFGDYVGFSTDQVLVGGKVVASGATTPGKFFAPTFQANAVDGELTFQFTNNGGNSAFKLNALQVQGTMLASAGPSQSANEGSPVGFQGRAFPATNATYTWNFGDGTTATGTLAPRHVYQDAGNYTAQLTVADGLGNTTTSAAAITVASVAPTATQPRAATTNPTTSASQARPVRSCN